MQKINTFEDFKRILYLCMIPFILFSMVSYNLMASNPVEDRVSLVLTRILITWYTIGWILVYKKRYVRFVELGTLIIISFAHIATVYDVIYNSMSKGKEGALGISTIWVPLVIATFFLILKAKRGALYSLVIFVILFIFGIINVPNLSNDYIMSLAQFYFSYLIYILVFFLSLYFIRLFTELDMMKKIAFTDSLTGIPNRHQLDIWLKEMIVQEEKSQIPLTILFLDIDHFKTINDTYGHSVGDSFLQEFSTLIKTQLPEGYFFGRWGGEEFLVLSHESVDKVEDIANKLREVIQNYNFGVVGKKSASYGITEFKRSDTVDSFLTRADKALYLSKTNGRNKITVM